MVGSSVEVASLAIRAAERVKPYLGGDDYTRTTLHREALGNLDAIQLASQSLERFGADFYSSSRL